MSTRRSAAWLVLLAFAGSSPPVRGGDDVPDKPANVETDPPFDDFLVIPLRVHVLTATDLPEIDCKLTDDDVARVIKKANRVWHRAGIHWGLESVRREPANHQDEFRATREGEGPRGLGLYRTLVPDGSREFDGLHVYYIHAFPVNGVWMGTNFAIVQETARLRPVEGGIDEPVPRVTAHELGHALGLPHRQDRTNLLASGTTGTLLNTDEVDVTRKKARRVKGFRTTESVKTAAQDAEAAGDRDRAKLYWTWLAGIPGGADESARELERLGATK